MSQSQNKRQSNFELLRIIAMCMIIAMHYLTKGMQLPKLSTDNSVSNICFWVLYAFCTSSVNVYVFISGYFMIDSEWKISKVAKLWLQVLCYSLLIPLVLGAIGVIDISTLGFDIKQQIFMPVSYEHYWFATAYVMLYLLSPVLGMAIKNMNRIQLRNVIFVMLAVFCGLKSVNPYLIPWDRYGCDLPWFICLFLIAGYIRMYGIEFFDSKKKGLLVYIIFSLLTFVIAYAMSAVVRMTGKLEYYMDMTYCYNYITVLIASIGLFYTFIHTRIGKSSNNTGESKLCRIINKVAALSFGVYLLHENVTVRELWPDVLGIKYANGQWWQIFHMLFCIIVIFMAGIIVDYFRAGIFGLVGKKKKEK